MEENTARKKAPDGVFRTLREDLRQGDLGGSVRRDFTDLRDFMLDEERKKDLRSMGWLRRWFSTGWWLIKTAFLKLTPARRLILVAGIILAFLSRSGPASGDNTGLVGMLCVLFVLMLELKDKLVARDELQAGHAVQEALLPQRSPHVPGWEIWIFTRSANDVGGDLIDFITISERHYAAVLGDVAGKGLRAALLMAKLQATVRAVIAEFLSPGELGRQLNDIFCRDSLRSIFASLVYIELRPGADTVRLLNAGHLPPAVVRKGAVEVMPKGGAALGLIPGSTFPEQSVKLGEGDFVCVYSDGLTEAQNPAGQFYGDRAVLELLEQIAGLPLEQIGERLLAEVDRFIGEAKRHDDLSLLLVRRTGRS
ncbi:MAG: serine/threonine-protein phosphatase [Ignavibacteria bacterium]|nr:serine/threonine-protein phosphatase [Ignavibacteria bacterium]